MILDPIKLTVVVSHCCEKAQGAATEAQQSPFGLGQPPALRPYPDFAMNPLCLAVQSQLLTTNKAKMSQLQPSTF